MARIHRAGGREQREGALGRAKNFEGQPGRTSAERPLPSQIFRCATFCQPRSATISNFFSPPVDDDGISVRSSEFGGTAFTVTLRNLISAGNRSLKFTSAGALAPAKSTCPTTAAVFRLRLRCKADPTPSRRSPLNADFLSGRLGQAPQLLRNDGGNTNHWLEILLIGTKSNRDRVGARVKVSAVISFSTTSDRAA